MIKTPYIRFFINVDERSYKKHFNDEINIKRINVLSNIQ